MRYVSVIFTVIFTPEPDQWGLRGDPFLWRLLEERYQAAELPYPPEALREDILRVFADRCPRRANTTMWSGLPKPMWACPPAG